MGAKKRKRSDRIRMTKTNVCSCGKRSYDNLDRAKAAHRTSSERLRFYKCPQSGYWHATNDEKNYKRQSARSKLRQAKRKKTNRSSRRKSKNELREW